MALSQKHRELCLDSFSFSLLLSPCHRSCVPRLRSETAADMSLRFSAQNAAINNSESGSSPSSEDEQDLTWEDWVSDSLENRPCKSLFDPEKEFPSVAEALNHHKSVHGVDLDAICSKLCTSLTLRNPMFG